MGVPAERADRRTSVGRRVGGAVGLAALAGLAWVARDVPMALGGRLTGARAERAARSPQYRDGTFRNPASSRSMAGAPDRNLVRELIFGKQKRHPGAPVPLLVGGVFLWAGLGDWKTLRRGKDELG